MGVERGSDDSSVVNGGVGRQDVVSEKTHQGGELLNPSVDGALVVALGDGGGREITYAAIEMTEGESGVIRVVGGGEEFWVWDRGAGQRRGGGSGRAMRWGSSAGGWGARGLRNQKSIVLELSEKQGNSAMESPISAESISFTRD